MARSENSRQFRTVNNAIETGGGTVPAPISATAEEETPEERIEAAFAELNAALQSDLHERVHAMDADDFERLIIEVMLGLGYALTA